MATTFASMSGGEILLILIIYLLFFGAKGIPSLAQTLGKALYQFRNATRDVQNEIMRSANDIRKQAEVRLDQIDLDEPTLKSEAQTHFHRSANATKTTENEGSAKSSDEAQNAENGK